ncbi:MAG: 2-C-methyl-D-erythritol 2,4-cyclodiphosphate synthase [Desulfobacteraceae bacterium]|nr:MAG: 2-C-methyl-D-erythritol 2,4-cyclodiphosphate synthase [Desulfobacteraceae bacterium]
MRVGIGYDIHRLVHGRKLILGGKEIPFEKGLLGHSDADVLVHAICDALLGAAGLGDIGIHFPDTDPSYKNICSLEILSRTCDMLRNNGRAINNIDSTVFAERPMISFYSDEMRENIARYAGIDESLVNIKATTTEGLGIIGKGEGIAAMCVALII